MSVLDEKVHTIVPQWRIKNQEKKEKIHRLEAKQKLAHASKKDARIKPSKEDMCVLLTRGKASLKFVAIKYAKNCTNQVNEGRVLRRQVYCSLKLCIQDFRCTRNRKRVCLRHGVNIDTAKPRPRRVMPLTRLLEPKYCTSNTHISLVKLNNSLTHSLQVCRWQLNPCFFPGCKKDAVSGNEMRRQRP